MRWKKVTSILLAAAMSASLFACGTKEDTKEAETKQEESTEEASKEEANNEKPYEGVTLNFITSYGGIETTFDEFTKKTGIKVEFVGMSSGEALAKFKAEEGKSDVDIWIGGGVDAFIEAANLGYIEPYISEESKAIDDMYKDPKGYWTGVSLQCAGFMVNNDLLKEKNLEAPKTWKDLMDPQYKDELMLADPSVSGTNYAMVSGILQSYGEEEGWNIFKAINENVPFYAEKGGEPPKKIAAGEFAVGVIPMTGEFFAYQDSYPVTAIYPEDYLPWTPAPVSIMKNSANMDAAKVFVDYILSKEGQEMLRSSDPRIMTRSDVDVPKEIGTVDLNTLVKLDVPKMGADRTDILAKWSEMVGNK